MDKARKLPQWPSFFPKNLTIPPADAVKANSLAYRMVRTIPPSAEDFCSTFEECPGRKFKTDTDTVNACGASMHTSLSASMATRERFKGFRNRIIAVGQLQPTMGYQKATYGEGHLSVWFYVDAEPHLAFTTNAEDSGG